MVAINHSVCSVGQSLPGAHQRWPFPTYADKDIQYILKQLKLIGNKRIQSNNWVTVDGVTFRLKKTEAGTMLSATPEEKQAKGKMEN